MGISASYTDDSKTYAIMHNAPPHIAQFQPQKEDQVYLGRRLRHLLTKDLNKCSHNALFDLITRIATGWEDTPLCTYYQMCTSVLKTMKTLEGEGHYNRLKLVEKCSALLCREGWAECQLALKTAKEDHRMKEHACDKTCLLYTSPSPRDGLLSRMPSSA